LLENKNIQKIILNVILTTCVLFLYVRVSAQEVRVINNKGTIANVNNNNVTTSATAPIDPVENDVWFDNSIPTNVLTKIYNGTVWLEVPTTNTQTVYTGSFIIPAPGGTAATSFDVEVNGLPFKPSQVTFVAHANVESFGIDNVGTDGLNSARIQNAFGTCHGYAREVTAGTFTQENIFIGGSGSSINTISRYSSSLQCLGIRYGNQNAVSLGRITGVLDEFGDLIANGYNGFTIDIDYTLGVTGNTDRDNDVLNESLVVLYTAYR